MFGINGTFISKRTFEKDKEITFDLTKVERGIYILRFEENNGGIRTEKLFIK